jgi:glycosyltransferase involved in cell wall biosynthesis
MLKVHILYEHSGDNIPHGASMLRLICPLTHPYLSPYFKITYGSTYQNIDTDIIIIDRLWKPDISFKDIEDLKRYTLKKNITLIYSLDDNLLDLRNCEPGNSYPGPNEKNIIRYLIRESDGVIVSTAQLHNRIKHMNSCVMVIENQLYEHLIPGTDRFLKKTLSNHITIGYMGTRTHDRDFFEILPAVKKILFTYKDTVKLEFLGALEDDRYINLLPNAKRLNNDGHVEYCKFWQWMNKHIFWDIALAPLRLNEFNACKSDIKFLDYSALAIPGIFSRGPSYDNSVLHGITGLLSRNETDEWVQNLEQLIESRKLREEIGSQAQEYLLSKRTLKKNIFKWKDVLEKITDLNSCFRI